MSSSTGTASASNTSALDELLLGSSRPLLSNTPVVSSDPLHASGTSLQSPAGVALVRPQPTSVPFMQSTFPPPAVNHSSLLPTAAVTGPMNSTIPLQPSSSVDTSFTSSSAANFVGADNPSLTSSGGLASLDALGKSAMEQSLSTSSRNVQWSSRQQHASHGKIPMNQMTKPVAAAADNISSSSSSSLSYARTDASSVEVEPLTDVFVPLESILPGDHAPLVTYDKNSVKIVFHIGRDRPRPDVVVVAVSVTSSNISSVKSFTFQAAVPKVMKVKLQPASATDLPAHNPILPPAAITQVMLIAHRPQDKILLKFKISYLLKDAMTTDIGEVQFPDTV